MLRKKIAGNYNRWIWHYLLKVLSIRELQQFNISASTKLFFEFENENSLRKILDNEKYKNENFLILGGGSNILFSKNFDGLILKNNILGIKKILNTKDFVEVEVGAGENWHEFVLWSVKNNLSGIENLALIPGLVGASPIQNIGAYGVEVCLKIIILKLKIKDNKFKKNKKNFEFTSLTKIEFALKSDNKNIKRKLKFFFIVQIFFSKIILL